MATDPHDALSPDDVEITAADSRETVRIFRGADAPGTIPARDRGAVRADYVPHPMVEEGLKRFGGSGVGNGAMARVLFSSATRHVSYAWFKSGFPCPPEVSHAMARLIPGAVLRPSPWSRADWLDRFTGRAAGSVFDLYPLLAPAILAFIAGAR